MASTRVTFDNLRGQPLVGYLEEPDVGEPLGAALFAHCFTCSKDLRAAAGIARALAGQGITTLRFDFTGLGHSGGDFESTSFKTNLDDLLAAAKFMDLRGAPVRLLVGHSLGGTACLAAAQAIPSVKAVATIGAPAEPEHATALFVSARAEIEQKGEAVVELAGRKFKITKELVDDLEREKVHACVANLGRPLLILHSPDDEVVELGQATKIFTAAAHPRSFIALDGADHLLTQERDYTFAADMVSAWARRYVG